MQRQRLHDLDALRDLARDTGLDVHLPFGHAPFVRGALGREVSKRNAVPGYDLWVDGRPSTFDVSRDRAVRFLAGGAT